MTDLATRQMVRGGQVKTQEGWTDLARPELPKASPLEWKALRDARVRPNHTGFALNTGSGDLGHFNCRGDYVVDGITYATDSEGNITGIRQDLTEAELDEIAGRYMAGTHSGRALGTAVPREPSVWSSKMTWGAALLCVAFLAFCAGCGVLLSALLVMLNPL